MLFRWVAQHASHLVGHSRSNRFRWWRVLAGSPALSNHIENSKSPLRGSFFLSASIMIVVPVPAPRTVVVTVAVAAPDDQDLSITMVPAKIHGRASR